MSMGTNILRLRTAKGFTQENLADKLGVTFQAVSAWERDQYKPDTDKLIRLAEELGTTVNALVYDTPDYETTDTLFDPERMKTYIKTTARAHGLTDSLKAVDFAVKAHEGAVRKNSDIPYIYHPLNLACHALAMGLYDDAVISACLLHDVVEDTDYSKEDLPVSDEAKEIVQLLTKKSGTGKKVRLKDYYAAILDNPKACLVKCLDRCNNLTTMSWGFTRKKMFEYIDEVDTYYPKLLRKVKETPEFYHAAWLLKYQMESMLDIYKRLLRG